MDPKTLAVVSALHKILTLILEGENDFEALRTEKYRLEREVGELERQVTERTERVAELEGIRENLFAEAKALDVRLDEKRPKLTGVGREIPRVVGGR